MKQTLICILFFAGLSCTYSNSQGKIMTEILQSRLTDYDPRVRPHFGENAINVNVTMYILRGMKIEEKLGLISLECYFRQQWNDPRLKYQHLISDKGPTKITTGQQLHQKIWEPDTFFANGKSQNDNREVFYRILPNGDVMKSIKTVIETVCPMDFKYYPMDVQLCALEAESYGYSAKDIFLNYQYPSNSIGVATDATFGNFRIVGFREKKQMVYLTTGNYSRLSIELFLVRSSTQTIIKYLYVPAIITFLVCWAAFWLPASSVLIRGILTFMSLKISMGLFRKSGEDVPENLQYMTRLDEYMITCSILALIALLETIGVYYLYRSRPGAGNLKCSEEDEETVVDGESSQPKHHTDKEKKTSISAYFDKGAHYLLNIRHHRRGHEKVDLAFIITYPILFALFNIIYWVDSYRKMNSSLETLLTN